MAINTHRSRRDVLRGTFPYLGLSLITLVSLMFAIDPAKPSLAAEVIYVANNKGGTITVIDATKLEVVDEFSVVPDRENLVFDEHDYTRATKYADDVVTSPDGRILYVSRPAMWDVAAFSTSTRELLWRVPTRGKPDHFALAPDGDRLFVSIISDQYVDVVDVGERKIVGGFRTSRIPHGMSVSPSGRYAVNGTIGGRRITIADAESFDVLRRFEFDEGVRPFVITKDEKKIYVQLSRMHGFHEVDFESGRITKTIHLPIPDGVTAQKAYPHTAHHGITLTPDEKYMCVGGTVADYVAILSHPSLDLEAIVPVGSEPGWVVPSLDGQYCYATTRASDELSVISLAERREIKRIKVGHYPQRLWTARVPDL